MALLTGKGIDTAGTAGGGGGGGGGGGSPLKGRLNFGGDGGVAITDDGGGVTELNARFEAGQADQVRFVSILCDLVRLRFDRATNLTPVI
jgi:hypothetical protein